MNDDQSLDEIVLGIQARNRTVALAERLAELRRTPSRVQLLPFLTTPIVLGLWLWSLNGVDLRQMNELGLASVLGPGFVAALVVLSASMAISLANDRPNQGVLLAHVLILILILYGSVSFLVSVPQGTAVYRHLGVANYVTTHGSVDRNIDAYFNWPGLFIGLAFLQKVTGLTSLAGIGAWAPVFFNLVGSLLLLNLFRFAFRDERLACLGIWMFLATNWIDQDILSPQAFGFLTYLTILVLLVVAAPALPRRATARRLAAHTPGLKTLGRFARQARRHASDAHGDFGAWPIDEWPRARLQRVLIVVMIVVLFGSVAISHQLSPYAILVVVTALILTNVSSARALPVLMALIIFTWFTYAAVPFLQQFLHTETQSFGEVRQNFSSSVTERLAGTREHELVVYLRLVMTGEVWGLALLSAIVRFRRGYRDTPFLIIATVPFVLAALQSYGGEIALRIYLFALPGAAFFIAALLALAFQRLTPGGIVLAITAVSFAFIPMFMISRYGNERLDYFTKDEYAAVQTLYRVSPPGSQFFVIDQNLPWRYQRYAVDNRFLLYLYVKVYAPHLAKAAETIANTMAGSRRPAFLIITRAQTPFAAYLQGLPPDTIRGFERAIAKSPRFRRVFSSPSAVVYKLAPRRRT